MLEWLEKLTDKQKTAFSVISVLLVMAVAFFANMQSAILGGENEWNLLVSLLYMLFWILFIKIGETYQPLLKTAYIIGLCTAFFALCGAICVNTDGSLQSITMIPALIGAVTHVPFWGLNVIGLRLGIYSVRWYYPVVTIYALCWVLYVRRKLKQSNK